MRHRVNSSYGARSEGSAFHWRPGPYSGKGLAQALLPLGKELKISSPLNPANAVLAWKLEHCLVPLEEREDFDASPFGIPHRGDQGTVSSREGERDRWERLEAQFLAQIC